MLKETNNLFKVAIIGPESTGKSSISQFLAIELDTVFVPEYSRYYCEGLDRDCTLQDELNMFYGQLALESALIPLAKHNLLVCDTTILTVKVWCEYTFGEAPTIVKEKIRAQSYDLYLLMDVDLPWEEDPLRNFPDKRVYFLDVWKKELNAVSANYHIISGLGEERLNNGLEVVRDFLQSRN